MDRTDTSKPTSPLLIAAAWIVVILPGAWGLRYTVQNALKLFTAPSTPAATQQPPNAQQPAK